MFSFVTSIVLIFIVSQFNPSTASFSQNNPPPDLNWFFVVSTLLILTGFFSFLVHINSLKRKSDASNKSIAFSLRKVDAFVVTLISIIIFMGFFSNLLLSENPQWSAYIFSILRILVFLLIVFYYCRLQ